MSNYFSDNCAYESICREKQNFVFPTEYVLPDYLPDVRKVLLSFSRIKQMENTSGNKEVLFNGDLSSTVVCAGEDGSIFSCVIPQSFSCRAENEKFNPEMRVFSYPGNVKSECALLSPKKISLKSSFDISTSAVSEKCVTPVIKGGSCIEDECSVEKNISQISFTDYLCLNKNEVRVSEDIEADSSHPELSELVACDIHPSCDEMRCLEGKAAIKGRAFTNILCKCADDTYISVKKAIPFSLQVENEGIKENYDLEAALNIRDIEAGLQVNQYGEKKLIELDFSVFGDICCAREAVREISSDAFSTKYESENEYIEFEYEKFLKPTFSSVSLDFESDAILSEGDRIICEKITPEISVIKNERDKITAEGIANCVFVVSSQDIDKYRVYEFPSSFKIVTSAQYPHGDFAADVMCEISDIKSRIDGNKIICNYDVSTAIYTFGKGTVNSVGCVKLISDKKIEHKDKSMTLVFPEKNESTWDMAKKYHISPNLMEKAAGRNYYIVPQQNKVYTKII